MGSYYSQVDFTFRLRESTLANQLWMLFSILSKTKEVVNIADLAEMWTDRIKETQLQEDVSLDKIAARASRVTVDHICIFKG